MKTLGTCSECKWWKGTTRHETNCSNVNVGKGDCWDGDGLWIEPPFDHYGPIEVKFFAGPSFACIHWEKKE